ncbi:hypothetical protein CYMTET_7429, partial [Cymbomonas tetramitiformis]
AARGLVVGLEGAHLLVDLGKLTVALHTYSKQQQQQQPPPVAPSPQDFFPSTCRAWVEAECEAMLQVLDVEDDMWVIKAAEGASTTSGFRPRLVHSMAAALSEASAAMGRDSALQLVIQQYVKSPLLLHGRKFHLRAHVLVAGGTPRRAFLHRRLLALQGAKHYDLEAADCAECHWTSLPPRTLQEEDRHMEGHEIQRQLWRSRAVPRNFINDTLLEVLRAQVGVALDAAGEHLSAPAGHFQLLNFEFLVDRLNQPWLLRVEEAPNTALSSAVALAVTENIAASAIQVMTDLHFGPSSRSSLSPARLQDMAQFEAVPGWSGERPENWPTSLAEGDVAQTTPEQAAQAALHKEARCEDIETR